MRKITIGLLLSMLVLTGCARFGRLVANAPNNCGADGRGYAVAGVYYGDSRLNVVPVINLAPGAEFKVFLLPRDVDGPGTATRDLRVTIEGDLIKDPLSGWITARTTTFNTSDDGFMPMTLCVPTTQARRDYMYKITVDEVGVLDPRARVN